LGDSITQLWPLPEHNAGIGGQTTTQMLSRFNADILGHGYKRVVILGGTNDVRFSQTGVLDASTNLETMAAIARAANIEVVLCKIPPITSLDRGDLTAQVNSLNSAIAVLAEERGYPLVDYYTPMAGHPEYFLDGLHPNPVGYAVMEKALWEVVLR
jgi:lysophospholipase L1-like esterase